MSLEVLTIKAINIAGLISVQKVCKTFFKTASMGIIPPIERIAKGNKNDVIGNNNLDSLLINDFIFSNKYATIIKDITEFMLIVPILTIGGNNNLQDK